MLLAAKLYIRDAEAEIVRRAAVDLMRAIVRTYDISLLQVNQFLSLFNESNSIIIILLNLLITFNNFFRVAFLYAKIIGTV